MKLFQNSGLYPAYRQRLDRLAESTTTFAERLDVFLNDRFGACHFLLPVLERDPTAFFTNGDDDILQRRWAKEQGIPGKSTLEDILLAQIEHHRTEVFYNLDPMRYASDFVRKLPGCVLKSIAWRAAPSPGADFAAYDLVVCNFPGILESYRCNGWKAAYFSPAHDPEMDAYADNTGRPIDVLFVGGYSRHHRRRAELLEAIAAQALLFNVVMHLDCSRLTRLAESPVGKMLPLAKHRRPGVVAKVAQPPVFGRDLYTALGRSKIVLNGAVDMAGDDRGNMRCFEAMGCGALMISDLGSYPAGMIDGKTMLTYRDAADAVSRIQESMQDGTWRPIGQCGHRMVRESYSKQTQWQDFMLLVGELES
jgi:hypothetical protein